VRTVTNVVLDSADRYVIRRAIPDVTLALRNDTDHDVESEVRAFRSLDTKNNAATHDALVKALAAASRAHRRAEDESDPAYLLNLWRVPVGRADEQPGEGSIIGVPPARLAADVAESRARQVETLGAAMTVIREALSLATPPVEGDD
jgi:hypothetical protein